MIIQNAAAAPANMALLTQGVDALSARGTALQGELSSEVLSDSYAGLGDQTYQALNLQPHITEIAGWQTNVTSAQNALGVTQTAMSQITTIATDLQTSLTSLRGDKSATNVSVAALQARQSLTELASLMNTQNGSRYVFAGNASGTAPVTDPSAITTGSFFQTIAARVAAVGTTGAAGVEAATVAAAADNTAGQSVFSSALSVSATQAATITHTVTVGDQDHVPVGFVATQGGNATPSSTGSSIRDLMRALAVVGSLDQADPSSSGFATLVDDTGTQMTGVSDSLNLSVASLGQMQEQLTGRATTLSHVSDALTAQLGSVKDSDPATLSAQITDTQNQLQASYSLIADMKGMSLASYL